MKKLVVVLFVLPTLAAFAQIDTSVKLFKPSILVEFFSSEGCSSCPIVDEFAQEITAVSDSGKLMVYTIDWHVDLWNQSGWKDPFSDSLFTLRQQILANANKQKAIFTPMAFVNGKGALPGGSKKDVGALIGEMVNKPANNFLLYTATFSKENNQLILEYEIAGKPDSLSVVFALLENEVTSHVTAGENKGKTLTHHRLVKKFVASHRETAYGTVFLPLGKVELDFKKYSLIGFLQHKRTHEVKACQMLKFNFIDQSANPK